MATDEFWLNWHRSYEDPESSLSRRLRTVQRRLSGTLDQLPEGPIQLISVCSGLGVDVIDVLARHPRRDDVRARLVEINHELVHRSREAIRRIDLDGVEVLERDASNTSAYVGAVPADIALVCGVFGNVSSEDIEQTISTLPSLLAPRGVVIWTRHREAPDQTVAIRDWFVKDGFEEIAFEAEDGYLYGVGTHQLLKLPAQFRPGVTMFTFTRGPSTL